MTIEGPTKERFEYDRRYPPLFFAKPTDTERTYWYPSMALVPREYFRMSRHHKISHQTPLSNGMTAGEYGMWLILMNHNRRQVYSK
jgi:hypothetical protein